MSDEKVTWRGTHGVGDFMQALNCCYRYSYDTDKVINLEMHWEHDEDFLYHPDDPETIIDRMNFIHPKYFESERVEVTHVFNSDKYYYPPEQSELKERKDLSGSREDMTRMAHHLMIGCFQKKSL